MKRKTFSIEELKNTANGILANSSSKISPDFRQGIINLTEDVLMNSGNYKGFQYIKWMNGGYTQWVKDGQPKDKKLYFDDETRIEFI